MSLTVLDALLLSLTLNYRFRPLSTAQKEQETVSSSKPKSAVASVSRPSRKTWKEEGELEIKSTAYVFFQEKESSTISFNSK